MILLLDSILYAPIQQTTLAFDDKWRSIVRVSEALLRLGCGLVAWMVTYAYVLWLGVSSMIGCGTEASEMHRLLLGMAPVTIGFSTLLRVRGVVALGMA